MEQTKPSLTWLNSNVPVSKEFGDIYYSPENGQAESEHVFFAGNQLETRLHDGFHIAELGFGTGLNFLILLELAKRRNLNGPIYFTSFEAFPIAPADLRKAINAATSFDPEPACNCIEFGAFQNEFIKAEVVIGDARETLPIWSGAADAWFLDGFSPQKNPELWEADLLREVARHTSPKGTVATYSAAGHVRNKLDTAGFDVSRINGFGKKKHMTVGMLRDG